MMPQTRLRLVLVLALLGAGACAPSLFHRHLDAHRWVEAADVFAADSSLQRDTRAVYRAALLHATPGTPAYDPARALMLLNRILASATRTPERVAAAQLQPVVAELERATVITRRQAQMEQEIGNLRREIGQLRAHRDSLRTRLTAAEEDQEFLRRTVRALEASLADRDAQVRVLQSELIRLKAIDLRPLPPPTPTPPPRGGEGAQAH